MFDENTNTGIDSEQKSKELDTLQLLVSAGYFRARIKGLSTFDKTVGGMTWCIQGCSWNIEIDLLFQENLNIGRKIALTEKIVQVLKKMKCPHRIEPHQIQGSDFINIYPVVQWLVKQTLVRQEERMADMKILSCQYFDRNTSFNADTEPKKDSDKGKWSCNVNPFQDCTNIVNFLQNAYFPQRKYKKPDSMKSGSEEMFVVSTLLEYGKKGILASLSESSNSSNVESSEKPKDEVDSIDVSNIQNQMTSQIKNTTKMAPKLISQLLELKIGDVQMAAEEYQAKSTVLEQSSQHRSEYYNKKSESVQAQLEIVDKSSTEIESQITDVRLKIKEMKQKLSGRVAELNEMKEKIQNAVGDCPPNINIEDIQQMVLKLEQLKEEKQVLKEAYMKEDEQLSEKLMKVSNEEEPEEDEAKISQLKELLASEKKRFQNGRLKLATKTRELKQLEIFLDDIPSKREIQQYQKRFVELNTEISTSFAENKQLYDMYNILDSVKDCLQREVNLLNSIHDNFKESGKYYSAKEQIIQQMQEVANAIRDYRKNGENQKEKIKADRDKKKEELNLLIEKSREYIKLTKTMQETWQYYDKLMQKCNELGLEIPNEN